jgi:quinol monooxygenase YgiN
MYSWGEEEALETYIFARFHARPGQESEAEEAVRQVITPTREEPGCLSIQAFRANHDPQLIYIYSRWDSEDAFNIHVGLPHTVRFLERMDSLCDRPREVTRSTLII